MRCSTQEHRDTHRGQRHHRQECGRCSGCVSQSRGRARTGTGEIEVKAAAGPVRACRLTACSPHAILRNGIALRGTRKLGRSIWKKWSGHHRRSLLETKMGCFKGLGARVMARNFETQVSELQVRASILNRFTSLGTPETVRVA